MSMTKTSVTAPSDLPGGYELPVEIDGQSQTVIVPDGGVKEGEDFTGSVKATSVVMVDAEKETDMVDVEKEAAKDVMQIPTGAWRDEFCGCCKYVSKCVFWSSWCCTPITFGQLLHRNGYNWDASPVLEGQTSNAFMIYLLFFILALTLGLLTWVLGLALHVIIVIIIMKIRPILREKYQIEGGSALCDCCAGWWCMCCTVMQMNSHTAEFDKYDTKCCTKDGLAPGSPEVV
jgi:Cys-rich protein (TIGR01571 family)